MSDVGVQGEQESISAPVSPMEGSGLDQAVSLETSSSTVGGGGGAGGGEDTPGAAEPEPSSLPTLTEGGDSSSEIPVIDAVEEPIPAPAQPDLEQQQQQAEEEEEEEQQQQQAEEAPVAGAEEEEESSPAPVVVEPEDEEEDAPALAAPALPAPAPGPSTVTVEEVVESEDSPPRPDNAQECIAVAATLPVYCPSDVARHASQDDAWVSLHGRVYNVTHLLQPGAVANNVGDCDMLMANAGKDVSPWFSPGGHKVKTFVDPVTNLVSPYLPTGRFPHVPPSGVPTTGWVPLPTPPWWQDPALVVGRLTAKARRIRVVNTLTSHEHFLDVGREQTIRAIATKYLEFNAHSLGYTWKVLKPDYDSAILPLDMEKTLEENHVQDEGEEIDELGLDGEDSDLLPTILLYYSDELTMA